MIRDCVCYFVSRGSIHVVVILTNAYNLRTMKISKVSNLYLLVGIIYIRCYTSGALNINSKFSQDSIAENDDTSSSLTINNNNALKRLANKFSSRLKDVGDTELGVLSIQNILESVEYRPSDEDSSKNAQRLAERMKTKLSSYFDVLNHSANRIQDFKHHSKKLCYVNVPCIYISENGSYEEPYNNSTVDFNNLPLSILNLTEGFTSYPELGINRNLHYFISEMEPERLTHVFSEDFSGEKCIIMDNPHFQRAFLKTVSNEPKQIVVLVDNGVSLSENQFSIAKSLANHIIWSLSEDDRVSLFAVSDIATSAMSVSPHHCPQLSMAYATHSLKHQFSTFIDDLYKSKGHTNHSLGFTMAFKTIEESMKNETANALIVYISRGLMSFITEAKTLMEVISQGQDSVIPNVIINTCVLIDDGKTILYEKHFMRVVAQQNFSKYNISNAKSEAGMVVKGTMVSVNSSSNIGAVVRSVLSTPNLQPHSPLHPLKSKPTFLMPTWDVTNKGELVVSITKTVLDKEGNLLGIVGVDIALDDLAEDIIFYNDFRRSYAFFVTTRGKAMVHPLMKQPSNVMYEQPIALDIANFETCQAFARSKNIIFHNISGVMSLQKEKMTYSWQHVPRTPYIIVTVNTVSRRKNPVWSTSTMPSSIMAPTISFTYHRLDLSSTGKYSLCRNFRQLSSLDTGSLYLSGWCFQSPYKHLLAEENISQLNVQSYMAYLKDTTKLLANPGLRPGIRSELISLSAIIPYWKKVYIHSSLSKYIVRKYAVTSSGAVVMYPGGVVNHRLDVMHRKWYMRAIEYPKVTTVTPPYLDSAGAGYVVTLSVAVGQDPVMFVLAVDFTLGAMFNLMVESLPSCSSPLEAIPNNMKCFLMDDRGYLIAHPSLIDPLAKGAVDEQHHITHRESLLANDLLNHEGLVKKLVCNDFTSNTVQRFYRFNMSLDHVVTNMISGEQCVRYQLTRLQGTNIFLGVVNTTCDLVTAFCPCNTIDRHCLNCNRMEQNECECPCECPLFQDSDYCEEPKTQYSNEPCPPSSEPRLHIPQSVIDLLSTSSIKPCFQTSCDQLTTHRSCLGVIGCEWCQLQSDGITRLPASFCTHQAYCYNGIIGSAGDSTRLLNNAGDSISPGLPFGSVGGAVFALVLALSLMLYCYCKHSVRASQGYMVPDSSFHMLTMDKNSHTKIIEEPPTGANTGLVSNAQELSVALMNPSVSVSPYRMSAGYRRPPTGDSDHGYSTMTPHEDTEPPEGAQPPTPPSPTPPHQTLLPHHIIAPVTVHMAMDT